MDTHDQNYTGNIGVEISHCDTRGKLFDHLYAKTKYIVIVLSVYLGCKMYALTYFVFIYFYTVYQECYGELIIDFKPTNQKYTLPEIIT